MPRLFRVLMAGLPFTHVSAMVGTSQLLEETRRDQMKQSEPWVSLEGISQHLGVSQDTVHRWIRNRNMPAHQIGRLWKFKTTEVDQWVRQGKAAEDAGKE
jgi:excisionase family DNA binding protein